MEHSCSFFGFGNISCGEAQEDVVKLVECEADISGHLGGCGLSKLEISEAQLILLRAGRFNVSKEQQQAMYICSAHRTKLGRRWRPLRSCQYPGHVGPLHQYKNRGVFNAQLSCEVQTLYGALVQIGSRKYLIIF